MDLKELEAQLQNEQVEKRLQAARALIDLDLFDESLFVTALGDEDWRVRKEAIGYFMNQEDTVERAELVVDQLTHPDNAGLRNAAIEILIALGGRTIKLLFRRLPSVDAEVRKFIVDILGEIGHPDSASELLPYLQDEDENVRYAVVETLGKLKSVTAVDALLDMLDSADAGLQFTIFEALKTIGKGVPVSRILPYAEKVLLRKSVFNCLGQLADSAAIPVLLKGLSDPMRKVREEALLSLGNLIQSLERKDCPEVDSQTDQVVDRLVDFLKHENIEYRRAACYVLSLFPDSRVVCRMLPLLADEELRADVVAAAKLIPKAIFNSLINNVEIGDENALFLIYMLGELGYPEIETLALQGIESSDPQYRYASIMTLGKVFSLSSLTQLGDALADDIAEIRQAASDALCLIGTREPAAMIGTVSPYLESPDAELRLLAVRTLGGMPKDMVESSLLLALKDVDAEVRCEALRGLTGYQSQRLLSGLSLVLTDEISDVRRLATVALGVFPAQRSLPILAHALEDSDPWVRMEAIRAVNGDDADALIPIIERGLADSVGLVVISALESAHRLLPESCGAYLQQALLHDDVDVVSTAVRLLLNDETVSELLNHERSLVRMQVVAQLGRVESQDLEACLEERLKLENDARVRQAIDDILRKGLGD